jgi:hypothetical protein
LGHIVGKEGFRVNPKKIKTMHDLTRYNNLKILCGFLGLTGYYREFVKDYGNIATPLTTLLKQNYLTWTLTVDHSFQSLKETMCTTLVLALSDFTKTCLLECDASGRGIGALIMKYGRPLAFTRKQMSEQHLGQSIYDKEILDILYAMDQ